MEVHIMANIGTMKAAVQMDAPVSIHKPSGKFRIKDPGSAITHFIGMVMAAIASVPLLIKAAHQPDSVYIIAMSVYAASLILLYAASTTYHTFDISERVNKLLKKIDHMMISILIAGSYTPVCLIALRGRLGVILLSIVWGIAIAGILIKAFWIFCPKWVSSVLYIGMGWTCVLAFTQLLTNLAPAAFGWLLAGGIIYTIGGVIYALKLPLFNSRHQNFGSHEIFHLFVMAGSACHFIVMYGYLLP
jgi:hemolysin III